MSNFGLDHKEALTYVLSWAGYAGALAITGDTNTAERIKEAVENLGGVVSIEQKNSISTKVSEMCKQSWDVALKKNNAWALRTELRNYCFATDPFHWDSVFTIQGKIHKACRRKKLSIVNIPYRKISTDVVDILGKMMDDDPELKTVMLLSELNDNIKTKESEDNPDAKPARSENVNKDSENLAEITGNDTLYLERSKQYKPSIKQQLFDSIKNAYSLPELRVLAFNIGIDMEEIDGSTKSEKITELINYCQRRNLLDKLIVQINKERDNILNDQ